MCCGFASFSSQVGKFVCCVGAFIDRCGITKGKVKVVDLFSDPRYQVCVAIG